MKMFREWRRRRWLREHPVSNEAWAQARAQLPLLEGLETGECERLRDLAAIFLQEKTFHSTHELELTGSMRLCIAAQACLLVLNLGLDWYRGWDTVIVYPGGFVHRHKETDEAGLVHEWDEALTGEAWERGPVIVSWSDVATSGRHAGYNVVIHELAHKLDMLNGPPDGFPPLHRDMDVQLWARVFTEAFGDFNRRLEAGEEVLIDAYAAEHPAEFFAVVSEYFFELPGLLRQVYPAVYDQLRAFYRQDPNRPGVRPWSLQ